MESSPAEGPGKTCAQSGIKYGYTEVCKPWFLKGIPRTDTSWTENLENVQIFTLAGSVWLSYECIYATEVLFALHLSCLGVICACH